jgi:hypothetical protein
MRIQRRIKIVLLLAVLMSLPAMQSALAQVGGCQGAPGEPDFLSVNPNAPGTKYYGTITLYYEYANPDSRDTPGPMSFFIRIGKDNNLYGFATRVGTTIDPTCYACQQTEVSTFLANTIIPYLYPHCPAPAPPGGSATCPAFALKSVSDWVWYNGGTLIFNTIDFVLAVKD